ncbi:hypothetical protein BpHYR1_040473 [Brachionus plicatilis]|uniref:Uncharacterized protein n=1 Tax=Brachionus plicatilis TaxID=10195 RepID=A0A3M7RED5_BRAPC|nr:hypothetical protein BpHYR1_040473 [Brachionus plicatilis]
MEYQRISLFALSVLGISLAYSSYQPQHYIIFAFSSVVIMISYLQKKDKKKEKKRIKFENKTKDRKKELKIDSNRLNPAQTDENRLMPN